MKLSKPTANIEPQKDNRVMSSEAWNQIFGWRILDPEGWDRQNFDYSWYQEEITREEFIRRTQSSTVYNREPLISEIGATPCNALKDVLRLTPINSPTKDGE